MNKYDVLETIGEGAYGVVIKARNKETGEIVAIKKFKESEEDEAVRKTTLREVKVLRSLREEPFVVHLLEAFRRKGRLYLVFEFVGENLLEYLERYPSGVAEEEVRRMVFTMVLSILACHNAGIIHRDIKPENLLVARDGTLRLCDFGFARAYSDGSKDLTDYVATRWYRCPELLLGTSDYGLPTDLWAVGCIMAELIDGQPLFPGETELDQLHLIQKLLGPLTPKQVDDFNRNKRFAGHQIALPGTRADPTALDRKFLSRLSRHGLHLLKQLLSVDPLKRPSAYDAVRHPYFEGLAKHLCPNLVLQQVAPQSIPLPVPPAVLPPQLIEGDVLQNVPSAAQQQQQFGAPLPPFSTPPAGHDPSTPTDHGHIPSINTRPGSSGVISSGRRSSASGRQQPQPLALQQPAAPSFAQPPPPVPMGHHHQYLPPPSSQQQVATPSSMYSHQQQQPSPAPFGSYGAPPPSRGGSQPGTFAPTGLNRAIPQPTVSSTPTRTVFGAYGGSAQPQQASYGAGFSNAAAVAPPHAAPSTSTAGPYASVIGSGARVGSGQRRPVGGQVPLPRPVRDDDSNVMYQQQQQQPQPAQQQQQPQGYGHPPPLGSYAPAARGFGPTSGPSSNLPRLGAVASTYGVSVNGGSLGPSAGFGARAVPAAAPGHPVDWSRRR